jgi:hypothetical protein
MLYLNAYLVSRVYGGPEEGGWWYDAGEPIACIPIPTKVEKGQDYYMNGGKAVIQKCRDCDGTGLIDCSDEECDCNREGRGYDHFVHCDCGEVPADVEALFKMNEQYKELLKEEIGRGEELRLAVEKKMGQPFPSGRPHYE